MKLIKATDGVHKYVAVFKNGRTTSFGAAGYDDYTMTGDKQRRTAYRIRHKKDLDTKDPYRAGYLSYYILWGPSTSIAKNVNSYNARFNV
jgi:hypothetical protein